MIKPGRNSPKFFSGLVEQVFARPLRGGKSLVYVYLRETDGTPYYVGIASTCDRPASKYHVIKPPRNRALIRILRCGLTRAQAIEWEKYFIRHYGRKDNGTGILRNLSWGGEGNSGFRHREETKRHLSTVLKGRKQSQEWITRRTSKIKGENNGMYGRSHTPEARRKMSESRTGIKKGPMSEEQKAKLSAAHKGKKAPWASKSSEAHKEACRLGGLERHRKARAERAVTRGVTVEELLKLEKKERNARAYANMKARKAQEAA